MAGRVRQRRADTHGVADSRPFGHRAEAGGDVPMSVIDEQR